MTMHAVKRRWFAFLLWFRLHRGQSLVEFALILPVALFLALGFTEVAMLTTYRLEQVNATVTLAAEAAQDGPGAAFDAAVAAEAARIGCAAPVVVLTTAPVVVVAVTCTYVPRITSNLWDGLPVTTSASALAAPSPAP